jgi:hypothetical protein
MMNAQLMQMIAGQLRQPPSTVNVGTEKDPIWKVSADGSETPEQAMAKWLQMMAETTGSESFDPDEWMKAQEDLYPEAPYGDGDAQ